MLLLGVKRVNLRVSSRVLVSWALLPITPSTAAYEKSFVELPGIALVLSFSPGFKDVSLCRLDCVIPHEHL